MYRTIAGLLALVAFVQLAEGNTLLTYFVDIVAQKLEDHLQKKNLQQKITYAECKAAFDDFEQWDEDAHHNNFLHGPLSVARNYLDDFMCYPMILNLNKFDQDEKLAEEFIKKLESTYERVRLSYTYRKPLKCGAGIRRSAKTCALIDALTGKGKPLTQQMLKEFFDEVLETYVEMEAISRCMDIYQHVDRWLELVEFYNTQDISTIWMLHLSFELRHVLTLSNILGLMYMVSTGGHLEHYLTEAQVACKIYFELASVAVGTQRKEKTCALIDALTGKGATLKPQMFDELLTEVRGVMDEMTAIWEQGDIYENVDKWLGMINYMYTPETYVCTYSLEASLSEENATKMEQGDPEVIQMYKDRYQNLLADFVYPE